MPSKPMTFGLVSSAPKRYEDNPSRNEPHVILIDYYGGSSSLSKMYRNYAMAQRDLRVIDDLGEVNDKSVKDTYIIPVSKVHDVLPDITEEMVRRGGYVPEQETLDYQYRMHYQRAKPSKAPAKKKSPIQTRRK